MTQTNVTATFQFMGDQFEHAWFFNRFRCDTIGNSILVTTALVSESGTTPAVNGFVLSKRDLERTKERSMQYLQDVSAAYDTSGDYDSHQLLLSLPPSRVYPVNHINLSRMDDVGEITLYRYSMHTLLNATRPAAKSAPKVTDKIIPCYPVVMFRSEVIVHIALLKELFTITE